MTRRLENLLIDIGIIVTGAGYLALSVTLAVIL